MLDVGTSASCEYSNGFSSDTSYNEEKENCNLTKRKGKAKIKAKSKKGRTRKLVDREKDKCIDVLFYPMSTSVI